MNEIRRLIVEKQNLTRRLAEIDAVLRQYETLRAKMERLLGNETPYAELSDDSEQRSSFACDTQQVTKAKKQDVIEFERVVRDVLTEANAPLDRSEIFRRVTQKGHVVRGNPPENVVSTRLSRMKDVSSRRGLGFWLTAREAEFFSPPNDKTGLSDIVG